MGRMAAFTHLHVRSAFSFLEGASSIEALCQRVLACGQPGFALTDRNGVYGMPAYLQACAFHGLTPIVGALLDGGGGEAVLLPRSHGAYAALCRVLSARHRAGPDFDLVGALRETPTELAILVADADLLAGLRERGAAGLYAELRRQRSPQLEAAAAALDLPCVASGAASATLSSPSAVASSFSTSMRLWASAASSGGHSTAESRRATRLIIPLSPASIAPSPLSRSSRSCRPTLSSR